ncbi:NACHT domain-containing protein, partial [Coleofasciculus sp.]|uniref:NACHT domain-containing protein n=1 Tax=Coleofasciculus sp. TaxID=3100458 RepID=UPI003A16513E
MDALVVWGVANAVGFVFGDVLKELAKGTLEDYTKDFYGYLKLETLDPGSYKYPMRLWQVFVPQTVREAMPLYDIPRDYLKRLQDVNQLDEQISPEELEQYREIYYRQPIRSVLDILHQPNYPYLVILGDPGSGKSTLAQYVALDWAEKPTKTIPLLIELRNYARDRTLPKTFLEFIHQGAAAICHLNQHRLNEVLETGDAFVLFDGLDEIFDPVARDTLITEIIRFTNQYPNVRVMVTSRIIGYKAQRLRDAQFRHFTLQDFEAEQIQAFVQKWHDLAFGNQPDKPRLQNRLQRAINESPAIRELAGNPLLLTMMAILNRNRELPRERAELYDEASRVLLHEWDIEKGLPPDEKLSPDTITRKEKQAMLRRVAYKMQAAPQGLAGNLINGDELEQILAEYLETLQDVEKPRTVSRLIIKQLRERNFILCFSGADCYSFVHRTFLEFFCAWEFVWQFKEKQTLSIDELKTEVFGKHWQEESWHEVLRLIAAMIDEQFVGEIIDYLIRQNGKVAKFRNLFLAAKCLTEVRSRSQISQTANQLL